MKSFLPVYGFGKGLQTRKGENFMDPDEFAVFQNVRVKGEAVRRPGQSRIGVAYDASKAVNFDGSGNYIVVPCDPRVMRMDIRASLRVVLKQDDAPSGDEDIIGWYNQTGPFSLKINSSKYPVFSITDANAVTTTLTSSVALTSGTKYSLLITRDKSSLKMFVNDTVAATGSMSASAPTSASSKNMWVAARGTTAPFGAITVSNYFDGDIDHILLLSSALPDNADGFIRPSDPLAQDVMAYYPMEPDANKLVSDLSRYFNTGLAYGTISTIAPLCLADSPINGMIQFDNGAGKTLLAPGGKIFNSMEVL